MLNNEAEVFKYFAYDYKVGFCVKIHEKLKKGVNADAIFNI